MIRSIKNNISYVLSLHNRLHNFLVLRYKKVRYVSYPKINGKLYIFKNGKIMLGENISINSGPFANPIGGDTRTVFSVASNAILEIGDYTGISNATIICRESIRIGKHVKIGGSVKIYDTDFHSLNADLRSDSLSDIGMTKPVLLKDYCFIGGHSIILKGVTIGEKSIVGAGSVVTKSIPDGQVWGGNPAKFIREL